MIVVQITYTGKEGEAAAFAKEMIESGTVQKIREEAGNIRYDYFIPLEDPNSILLIDAWQDQDAIDAHHASEMMGTIAALRDKHDLHMKVERLTDDHSIPESDHAFIRS